MPKKPRARSHSPPPVRLNQQPGFRSQIEQLQLDNSNCRRELVQVGANAEYWRGRARYLQKELSNARDTASRTRTRENAKDSTILQLEASLRATTAALSSVGGAEVVNSAQKVLDTAVLSLPPKQSFILTVIKQIADGTLKPDSFQYAMMASQLRFNSLSATTSMHYTDGELDFCVVGVAKFGQSLLTFLRGPMHEGEDSEDRSPKTAKLNIAVPSAAAVKRHAEKKYSSTRANGIDLELIQTITESCVRNGGAIMNISFDGTDAAAGISEDPTTGEITGIVNHAELGTPGEPSTNERFENHRECCDLAQKLFEETDLTKGATAKGIIYAMTAANLKLQHITEVELPRLITQLAEQTEKCEKREKKYKKKVMKNNSAATENNAALHFAAGQISELADLKQAMERTAATVHDLGELNKSDKWLDRRLDYARAVADHADATRGDDGHDVAGLQSAMDGAYAQLISFLGDETTNTLRTTAQNLADELALASALVFRADAVPAGKRLFFVLNDANRNTMGRVVAAFSVNKEPHDFIIRVIKKIMHEITKHGGRVLTIGFDGAHQSMTNSEKTMDNGRPTSRFGARKLALRKVRRFLVGRHENLNMLKLQKMLLESATVQTTAPTPTGRPPPSLSPTADNQSVLEFLVIAADANWTGHDGDHPSMTKVIHEYAMATLNAVESARDCVIAAHLCNCETSPDADPNAKPACSHDDACVAAAHKRNCTAPSSADPNAMLACSHDDACKCLPRFCCEYVEVGENRGSWFHPGCVFAPESVNTPCRVCAAHTVLAEHGNVGVGPRVHAYVTLRARGLLWALGDKKNAKKAAGETGWMAVMRAAVSQVVYEAELFKVFEKSGGSRDVLFFGDVHQGNHFAYMLDPQHKLKDVLRAILKGKVSDVPPWVLYGAVLGDTDDTDFSPSPAARQLRIVMNHVDASDAHSTDNVLAFFNPILVHSIVKFSEKLAPQPQKIALRAAAFVMMVHEAGNAFLKPGLTRVQRSAALSPIYIYMLALVGSKVREFAPGGSALGLPAFLGGLSRESVMAWINLVEARRMCLELVPPGFAFNERSFGSDDAESSISTAKFLGASNPSCVELEHRHVALTRSIQISLTYLLSTFFYIKLQGKNSTYRGPLAERLGWEDPQSTAAQKYVRKQNKGLTGRVGPSVRVRTKHKGTNTTYRVDVHSAAELRIAAVAVPVEDVPGPVVSSRFDPQHVQHLEVSLALFGYSGVSNAADFVKALLDRCVLNGFSGGVGRGAGVGGVGGAAGIAGVGGAAATQLERAKKTRQNTGEAQLKIEKKCRKELAQSRPIVKTIASFLPSDIAVDPPSQPRLACPDLRSMAVAFGEAFIGTNFYFGEAERMVAEQDVRALVAHVIRARNAARNETASENVHQDAINETNLRRLAVQLDICAFCGGGAEECRVKCVVGGAGGDLLRSFLDRVNGWNLAPWSGQRLGTLLLLDACPALREQLVRVDAAVAVEVAKVEKKAAVAAAKKREGQLDREDELEFTTSDTDED